MSASTADDADAHFLAEVLARRRTRACPIAADAATPPDAVEPMATAEPAMAESETPIEIEAERIEAEPIEAETIEIAPIEAAEDCDFCHEPGHSFNNCPHNRGPEAAEESGIEIPTAE
jgi:formylmethanofuran dehydrogenase subunit E